MTIRVHIERLALDELSSGHDVRGVCRGLQNELTRLLREGGLSGELRGGAMLPSRQGGDVRTHADRSAIAFGTRIAAAVYEGIGSQARSSKRWSRGQEA